MNQQLSWQYGYEFAGRKQGYQLPIRLTTCCTCGTGYWTTHCGGCNPGCNPDDPGVAPTTPGLPALLGTIGGLALDQAAPPLPPEHDWPTLVPLVWDNADTVPAAVDGPVAVRPHDLFRVSRSGLNCTPLRDIRAALRLPPETTLWLAPGAPDRVLEWMWSNPSIAAETIATNRFDLVAAPNFSVYGDECPVAWAVNAKRSIIALNQLGPAARLPVPTVSLPNRFFVDRWAEWITKRKVSAIAINTQMWRPWHEFHAMSALVVRLRELVGPQVHFLLFGPSARSRIAQAMDLMPGCTVVSSYQYNGGHQSRDGPPEKRWPERHTSSWPRANTPAAFAAQVRHRRDAQSTVAPDWALSRSERGQEMI